MRATRAIQDALRAAPHSGGAVHKEKPSRSTGDVEDASYSARTTVNKQQKVEEVESAGAFTEGAFESGNLSYRYRLYVPSRKINAPIPVVVMLHGCKQDAADFARGVDLHPLADREQFIVLYPEQLRASNQLGCWNWFHRNHQSRDGGEPAMIAALAIKIARDFNGDLSRIYVAGLSAGGAMAALVAKLYPDVFAAVGIHSGLAPGAAKDVVTAFSVMSNGPRSGEETQAIGVPTIVFQGTGDRTVSPANANAIADAELKFWASAGTSLAKHETTETSAGTRSTQRSSWKDRQGLPFVEIWKIKDGPHAWSGGDATGSFTDAKGPSASSAMVDFFKHHSRHK